MNRLNSKTSMSTNRCDRPSPMLRRIPAGWQSRETNRNLLQRLLPMYLLLATSNTKLLPISRKVTPPDRGTSGIAV